jgi:type IV pilus assembly protein PilB
MEQKPMKLGEMLIQAGKLNAFQLQSALSHQRNWGGRLGGSLVNLGYITEHELLGFLAQQLNLPRVNLFANAIPRDVLNFIPAEKAKELTVLPLQRKEIQGKPCLLVAMSDPTNLNVIDAIQFMTGCRVRPALASEREVLDGINLHYFGIQPPKASQPAAPSAGTARSAAPSPAAAKQSEEEAAAQFAHTFTAVDSVEIGEGDTVMEMADMVLPEDDPSALAQVAAISKKFRQLLEVLEQKGVLTRKEFEQFK